MAWGETTKRVRTCVGCGAKESKAKLLRVVRCGEGAVRFDPRGNEAGRGAYVCSPACFDKAHAKGLLQRALRVSMSKEDAQAVKVALGDWLRAQDGSRGNGA